MFCSLGKEFTQSSHSHVYDVLQRTAGLPVLCVCPVCCDSEKHPGYCRGNGTPRNIKGENVYKKNAEID